MTLNTAVICGSPKKFAIQGSQDEANADDNPTDNVHNERGVYKLPVGISTMDDRLPDAGFVC
jgi:hypothetical protein